MNMKSYYTKSLGILNLIPGFIITALLLTSCGYRFAGQGNLPKDIKSIHIEIFKNNTAEIAAEHIFTNDLISEFNKHGIQITSKEKADAVLTCVINSMRIDTVSRRDSITSLERRITGVVSANLKDSSGNTIWMDSNIDENETYNVMTEKTGTDYGKKNAVRSVAKKIAEEIYNRLTQEF
ncbi:LPS-assembly lipoprotein LptE domain-containing protein [Desulfonema limicola]|uniref:LPS-assembly lipoprotein LptE domain-containing protein n=1 Tax=Desulfonema limicola TaxID=45656 RepID=A0A975B661_9BACT|nr:LptE family protein [Desulfonema limicola]QTA79553.1 LPS-assembly lipoprotein LptE domain-containing protein [Desulfonema limicola]